jgi:hypothetical protein
LSKPIVPGSPYYELVKPIGLAEKARLILEILRTYGRVRWLLWRRDLPSVVAEVRAEAGVPSNRREQAMGVRLGHAVGRTLSWLPSDSRCLVRSLVLTSMLARRGFASKIVIGVTTEPKFSAHAWVESGGRALLPPLDEPSRLVEL